MQEQRLIQITEDNLMELAFHIASRINNEKLKNEWVLPEEAEKLLNLKRQTILKLNEQGKIDLTWPGMEGSKNWMASRSSIEKHLESKRNYNLKK